MKEAGKVLFTNGKGQERLLIRQERGRKSPANRIKGTPWHAIQANVHSTGLKILTHHHGSPISHLRTKRAQEANMNT